MRIFTLLAGYAAGLAVAMKYRKNQGTSKLDLDTPKNTVNTFFDEVVDIHKTAFLEVKGAFTHTFSDVQTLEDLQKVVTGMVEDFSQECESALKNIKDPSKNGSEEIITQVASLYQKMIDTLESAKSKAQTFAGISEDQINDWFGTVKEQLDTTHKTIRDKISTTVATSEDTLSEVAEAITSSNKN